MIATKRYTAPEVGKAYTRALELCRQIGETPQLFPVLGGLAIFYGTQGEIQTARELEEQRMRLAQSVQDPVLLLEASHTLGNVLFWFGEFASAQAHLDQSITLTSPFLSNTALIFTCRTPRYIAYPIRPGPYGFLAIRTKPWREYPRRSP